MSVNKKQCPEFIHYGGAEGVTGSCHRLQVDDGHGLLVDCGLFQGNDAEGTSDQERELRGTFNDDEQIDPQHVVTFDLDTIQALIITHVHIDHIGRLPYLLAAGFKGPIICSRPSAKLLPLVLEDALKIGFTRNSRLIQQFLSVVNDQLVPLDYKCWHSVVIKDHLSVKVKLHRAGHILGSSYVEVALNYKESPPVESLSSPSKVTRLSRNIQKHPPVTGQKPILSNKQRVIFSGDLGAPYAPLLPAPKSPYKADYLVLESTYGDRLHGDRRQRSKGLKQAIDQAINNKGTVVIPAFSMGRTQELLYELEDIIHRGNMDWQMLDVIVDSPLAARFTDLYRQLKPYWDKEAHRRLRKGRLPLGFDNVYKVQDHKTHLNTVEYLAQTSRPAVVIAASGMCSGGRVVNYLKALLTDARHQVLFVGYQAKGTPGYAIQKYGPRGGWVELDGQKYRISAQINTISGYSAHGDQKDLVNFIKRMRYWPKEIRLVHGDLSARRGLKHRIEQLEKASQGNIHVVLPDNFIPS
jgi:metallo-beta-lactamase family protein